MADQNITALPKKTSSQMAATDYLLGIDSAEGYQMLIQDLGDYIIQHATSSLAGANQTLAAAVNALNSKLKTLDMEATTTGSGAVLIPTAVARGTFICACTTDGQVAMIYRRDLGYLTVKDGNTLQPLAETSVTIRIWYMDP